jgi:general stress protein 26
MTSPAELRAKFWDALGSDMTMMIGLDGVEDGHARPMTAQIEGPHGPIWFFTSRDNGLVQGLSGGSSRAIATFVSKGHDLFATVHGALVVDTDRAAVDRLWNRFIAAWFEGGKDDPNLVLLRLDAERAEIWLNENNFLAGIKMLVGIDPQQDYADQTAEVPLR